MTPKDLTTFETLFNSVRLIASCIYLHIYTLFSKFKSYMLLRKDGKYMNNLVNQYHIKEPCRKELSNKTEWSIMSYNIHGGFDIYNKYTINKIIHVVDKEDIDILCIQELYSREQFNYIKSSLGYTYGYCDLSKGNSNGIGICSRFPIKENTFKKFNSHGICYTNSYSITKLDMSSKDMNQGIFFNKLYIIQVHLSHDITGYKQTLELDEVSNFIKAQFNDTDKIIVIGDFNTPQYSYYNSIFNRFNTLNFIKCTSFPTYPSIYPIMNLDLVYSRKNITINDTRAIHTTESDHFPIITRFNV